MSSSAYSWSSSCSIAAALVGPGMNGDQEHEQPTEFAQIEARMIRTALTDEEWAELIEHRPSLPASLAAYERWEAEVETKAG
ncbi:hypothetical protein [Streptomyces sp. NPDC018711]